ncbi:MAG: PIG-L family deacetylase [Clostridia bacterium]|nr:PIG-L family deacetylase [Clostridia bacterium]MDR3644908.1 PIG-L family deacetylase [Clostridia bacterium]
MNILAVGCHPDDLEIACFGTLAKYVQAGDRVVLCHVANGDKGHAVILPPELREIRTKEAEEAGRLIGAAQVINLDVPDLMVDSKNEELIKKMVGVIRQFRPDVIITHSPTDYMKDHVEVCRLVFDASFNSSVPHYCPEIPAYPPIVPIYYMDTLAGVDFMPSEYVDITGTIELKLRALACHESQIKWMLEHDKVDFIDFVRTVSKFRGFQCGAGYAEGFTRCAVWPRVTAGTRLP